MGIFNFATETIINNLIFTDGNGNTRPRVIVQANPQAPTEKLVNILQLGKFPKFDSATGERTIKITKVQPVAPVKEVMDFDFTGLDLDVLKGKVLQLQLDMILQGSGSQDGASAQFAVHKGEPFYCEYFVKPATASLAALVTDFAKVLNAYFTKGDRKQINVTAAGSKLTITATDPYQRFVEGNSAIVQVNNAYDDFPYAIVDGVVSVKGNEGKGNYWQLLTNLRLPTLEATYFGAQKQDERPIAGAQYIQYTLFLRAEGSYTGAGAVGELITNATAHTIFLLKSQEAAFDAFFTDILSPAGFVNPEA